MKTYRTAAAGRRMLSLLLLGALAIWGFALWSFAATLGVSYNPLEFFASLSAALRAPEGFGVSRAVPALLMLVLIIATPLLIWNVLAEWAVSYTPTAQGLRYTAPAVDLLIPWEQIAMVEALDGDGDERLDALRLRDPQILAQITNRVARFLHAQAHGRQRLLIYPGVAEREALIAEIRRLAESEVLAQPDQLPA